MKATKHAKQTRPARTRRAASRPAVRPVLPMPSELHEATTTADIVLVPARTLLAIDGKGAPEDRLLQKLIGVIYGVVYTLKFARKKAARLLDFRIGPLEARWWTDDPVRPFMEVPRDQWRWRVRMAVPADVTDQELAAAVTAATGKKGGKLEGSADARRVVIERLPATRYGRALHVGPYAEEGKTFARILDAIDAAKLTPGRAHLEVYLNDPRRTAPEQLKTVLLLELTRLH